MSILILGVNPKANFQATSYQKSIKKSVVEQEPDRIINKINQKQLIK